MSKKERKGGSAGKGGATGGGGEATPVTVAEVVDTVMEGTPVFLPIEQFARFVVEAELERLYFTISAEIAFGGSQVALRRWGGES